ncbi:MAG: hypothetical protein AAGB19_18280 [Cyanobacteria bacterium P01_F01_bin.3]
MDSYRTDESKPHKRGQAESQANLSDKMGRSFSELNAATGNLLVNIPDAKVVFCGVCSDESSASALDAHCNKLGVFRYDSVTHGVSFEKGEHLPLEFSALKSHVSDHLSGKKHQAKVVARKNADEMLKQQAAKEKKCAKNVLETGYFCLKKSLPHSTFEEMLYHQKQRGINIGQINDSADFLRRMRSELAETIKTKLIDFIASQPCVGLAANKVTIAQRTVDITAVVALVPEAPKDSMVQSFVPAAPVVDDHTGDGMASELAGTLKDVGISDPDKLAAICTDGQYLQNSVPSKLLNIMARADERREVSP